MIVHVCACHLHLHLLNSFEIIYRLCVHAMESPLRALKVQSIQISVVLAGAWQRGATVAIYVYIYILLIGSI